MTRLREVTSSEDSHLWCTLVNNTMKKITVFWVAAPCNFVDMHQRFGGVHCLHPRGGETEATGSFHTMVPHQQTTSIWYHIPECDFGSHRRGNL
jgi:hypothetical protein